jgi:hypothetical protein
MRLSRRQGQVGRSVASSFPDSGGAGSSRGCGTATSCRSSKEVAAPSSPNGLSRRAPAAAVDGCNSEDPASIDAGAIFLNDLQQRLLPHGNDQQLGRGQHRGRTRLTGQ